MNTRILTLVQLVELDACPGELQHFKEIFGDQVEVSVERFSQPDVIQARFDFDWAVDLLLDAKGQELYYEKQRERREALKAELSVSYYHQVPRDLRIRIAPALWADCYVKSTYIPPVKKPRVEGTVSVTPVEEIREEENVSGY